MIVTRTEPCTKTKFKVYLDGEFAFVLYRGEMKRWGICEGGEVADEIAEKIRNEVVLKRARLYAMHLLEDMDRTESALREKLKKAMYPESAVEGAVEYVRSFGYLDDRRYAENFVLSRKDVKSRREIRALLLRKGIPPETADAALETCCESGGEYEAIRKIFRKKHFDPVKAGEAERQKIFGYLARKGFRYEDVRQVIQDYNENA